MAGVDVVDRDVGVVQRLAVGLFRGVAHDDQVGFEGDNRFNVEV